jgi:hypothetical protein
MSSAKRFPACCGTREQNPDGWKDFVELAKSTGAVFLTMHSWALDREELDRLSQRLAEGDFRSEEDLEESRWLKAYIGKTGFVQLGWAYQGCVFVYEAGTEWYERYQHLRELADDSGGFMIDEPDQDESGRTSERYPLPLRRFNHFDLIAISEANFAFGGEPRSRRSGNSARISA